MRILQVTAGLNEGGVERGTLEMAAFIISQGSESIVASNGGKLVAKLKQSGATHILSLIHISEPTRPERIGCGGVCV